MKYIFNTNQKNGEAFTTLLQRWRRLFYRYARSIPKKENIEIFIENINNGLSYRLQLQCPPTFEKLIENRIKI
jgi:hypothetical protein